MNSQRIRQRIEHLQRMQRQERNPALARAHGCSIEELELELARAEAHEARQTKLGQAGQLPQTRIGTVTYTDEDISQPGWETDNATLARAMKEGRAVKVPDIGQTLSGMTPELVSRLQAALKS
jgi:hypothetical protein